MRLKNLMMTVVLVVILGVVSGTAVGAQVDGRVAKKVASKKIPLSQCKLRVDSSGGTSGDVSYVRVRRRGVDKHRERVTVTARRGATLCRVYYRFHYQGDYQGGGYSKVLHYLPIRRNRVNAVVDTISVDKYAGFFLTIRAKK